MAQTSSVNRAGKTLALDIRVVFMLQKITLTEQRMQGSFPNRLLEGIVVFPGESPLMSLRDEIGKSRAGC